MARIEMDLNLKKLGYLFQVVLCQQKLTKNIMLSVRCWNLFDIFFDSKGHDRSILCMGKETNNDFSTKRT